MSEQNRTYEQIEEICFIHLIQEMHILVAFLITVNNQIDAEDHDTQCGSQRSYSLGKLRASCKGCP